MEIHLFSDQFEPGANIDTVDLQESRLSMSFDVGDGDDAFLGALILQQEQFP